MVRWCFYGGGGLLLGLAVTGWLGAVLPAEAAKDVAEDSEALLLALAVSAWIEFARPRLLGRPGGLLLTCAPAVGCLLLGGWMFTGAGLPRTVSTLGEPVLALAVLLPYLQLRRPVPRLLVAGLPAAVLLLTVPAFDSDPVTRGSEALALLVLVPIGLDAVDRGILDPAARPSAARRWTWYALLLAVPLVLSLVLRDSVVDGVPGQVVAHAIGVQEAWLAVLLVHLYPTTRRAASRRYCSSSASGRGGLYR